MIRSIALGAALTGLFCAGFAVVVDVITDALPMMTVVVLAFVSGFLGSVFAQTVMGRWRQGDK